MEEKTPMGEIFVEVSFEDGSKEVMPKKRLEMISTEAISSDSLVREVLRKQVGSILFGVMHEYGIKIDEVDPCIDTVVELVNNSSAKSYEILFGYEKTKIPLNAINKILMANLKDNGDKTS
ncbi:MAG TPA: hypothetical protein PKO10_00725 [Aliarcobacter cryaerophilus]|nr:hypothetical protein [Aliarcobacter cryaerophilus]